MVAFKNLIGNKYNRLTVLERAENINGRVTWKCQCECGREVAVERGGLTSGRKKDCGECNVDEKGRRTRKHKKKIGDVVITNNNGKLEILDCIRKPNYEGYLCKCYKYKCLECGYEGETTEGNIIQGQGCSCCSGNSKTIVEGINDITTTEPWMVKFFQGGYEEAKQYTRSTHKKIFPICPDCGRTSNKRVAINNICKQRSIGCSCGDGISYPEKIVYSLLEQLGIDFITQLNKSTLNWCNGYKYDFFVASLNMIIETHGGQHFEEKFKAYGDTLKKIQENDRLKEQTAKQNGIARYIVIDCRLSELELIKNNLLNSELNGLIDFSKVDWLKCEEFAMSNLAKEICIYRNNNKDLSANAISKIFKIGVSTITIYLNRGNILGWCEYNGKEEMKKSGSARGKLNSKKVEMFKDVKSLGIFNGCSELERISEELVGVKLHTSAIASVCRGEKPHHKGYTFKYVMEE